MATGYTWLNIMMGTNGNGSESRRSRTPDSHWIRKAVNCRWRPPLKCLPAGWGSCLVVLLQVLSWASGVTGYPNRHGGSRERTLRIATVHMEPYVELRWGPGLIANERYDGFLIDVLKELAREAQFSYQLYLVPDGQIGQRGDDGTWNGLLGELTGGSADIALAPIIVTNARQAVVDFTTPLDDVTLSALSPTEDMTSSRASPYGVVMGQEVKHFLSMPENSVFKQSLKDSPGLTYVDSILDGLDRVRSKQLHLLLDSNMADYYVEREPCDLSTRSLGPTGYHYALALRNNSALVDRVNAALQRLSASRSHVLESLKAKWWPGGCTRPRVSSTEAVSTTLPVGGPDPDREDRDHRQVPVDGNRRLTITSVLSEPYLMRSRTQPGQFEGYIADLVHEMAQLVPFEYQWRLQRTFGRHKKNGKWTGMVGDLLSERADMAAAPFVIDNRHLRHLTFTKPFLHSTYAIVTHAPGTGTGYDVDEIPLIFMEDLVNQTEFGFGVVKGSHVARQLRKSKIPLFKEIWRDIKSRKRENEVATLTEGLAKVRSGRFALIMESAEATYLSSKPPCDLLSNSQFTSVTNYAFAAKKGSLLVEELDNALLRIQEGGILQTLFHKWWNSDECAGQVAEEGEVGEGGEEVAEHLPEGDTDQGLSIDDHIRLHAVSNGSLEVYVDGHVEGYVEGDNVNERDWERIFITSPGEEFTPRREYVTSPSSTTSSSTTSSSTAMSSAAPTMKPDQGMTEPSSRPTPEILTRVSRRRSTLPPPPPPPPTTPSPLPPPTPRPHQPNFDDFDAIFATEQPRPDVYEDYDVIGHVTPFLMPDGVFDGDFHPVTSSGPARPGARDDVARETIAPENRDKERMPDWGGPTYEVDTTKAPRHPRPTKPPRVTPPSASTRTNSVALPTVTVTTTTTATTTSTPTTTTTTTTKRPAIPPPSTDPSPVPDKDLKPKTTLPTTPSSVGTTEMGRKRSGSSRLVPEVYYFTIAVFVKSLVEALMTSVG